MNKRMNIIKHANPNLVVSIHMNSFTDNSACGASTYYRKDDAASKKCADLIQKSLSTHCNTKNDSELVKELLDNAGAKYFVSESKVL